MTEQLKISCYGCGQKLDLTDLEPFIKIHCPICSSELIIPKPFGNLLLEENIGGGEIANVFRAIDITLDREIAVKVLKPQYSRDPEIAKLIINEASTASAINHPNLVPIYSCGEMEDEHYIVMQYMRGGGLLDYAKEATPGLDDMYRWFFDAAKGLETAAIHGVLHHDVRPSNILLDQDGNLKIADFGLTQIVNGTEPLDVDAADRSPAERFFYLSPEQVTTGRQDMSGDLFSLGASFYHVLTKQPPFKRDNVKDTINCRFTDAPTPPHKVKSEITLEVSELIMKMLSVYPSERPRSYAAVTDVIGAAIEAIEAKPAAPAPKQPAKPEPVKKPEKIVSSESNSNARDESPSRPKGNKPRPKNRARAQAPLITPNLPAAGTVRSSSPFSGLLPALIVVAAAVLAVAHVKNPPWYQEHIRPLFGGAKPVPQPQRRPAQSPRQPAPVPNQVMGSMGDAGKSLFGDGKEQEANDDVIIDLTAAPPKPAPEVAPAPQPAADSPALAAGDIQRRPRPHDLDFFGIVDTLTAYVESLPSDAHKQIEATRMRLMGRCQPALIEWMQATPYTHNSDIMLRNGDRINGRVPTVSKQELVIEKAGGNRTSYAWYEIAFEQYLTFLEHYVQLREQGNGQAQVGDDYMRMAVLADWYNHPAKASNYAKLAVRHNPQLKAQVAQLVPSRVAQ